MVPQAVKGTKDILPAEHLAWNALLASVSTVLGRAGVEQISVPIFEHTEVFTRSAGESSDLVVQKEMYTFLDRGGRSLTLRPEFTGGVLRAFHENGMASLPSPIKLWSHGPIFRGEQVQRGRYRQFNQVNCEVIGLEDPLVDAEVITLAYDSLIACGLSGLIVKLGSVGDPKDRARYNSYLRGVLEPHRDGLSEASKTRLDLNPLRIWDSKDDGDQQIIQAFETPLEALSDGSKLHLNSVKKYLDDWGIPLKIDPTIVRGLDYYRKTAFEVHHNDIGAQSTILGGGRYDGLLATLGGTDLPGIGWAFGIERVLAALSINDSVQTINPGPDMFFVPVDEDAVFEIARLARSLRDRFRVAHAYRPRKPGKGLREAQRSGAPIAILRGSAERKEGVYTVKELMTGDQTSVRENSLRDYLCSRMTNDKEVL
jgi:histidyl-tRNA synthetase